MGLEAAPSSQRRHGTQFPYLDVKLHTKGGGRATSVLVPMYDDDDVDDRDGHDHDHGQVSSSTSLRLVDKDLTAAAVGTTELTFLLRKITELKAELDRRKRDDAEHGLTALGAVAYHQASTPPPAGGGDDETAQLRRRVAELAQRVAAAGAVGSENTLLRSKISNLTAQSRRADELRREVEALRKELQGAAVARQIEVDSAAAMAAVARERDALADRLRQAEAALAADRERLEAYTSSSRTEDQGRSRLDSDDVDVGVDDEVIFDWDAFAAWAQVCGGLAALHLAVTAALTAREARRAAARVREDLAAAAALTEVEERNEELQKQVGRRGGGNHTAGACRDLHLVFVSPWCACSWRRRWGATRHCTPRPAASRAVCSAPRTPCATRLVTVCRG